MNAVAARMNKVMTASASVAAKQVIAPDAAFDAIAAALVALGVEIPEDATPADYAGLIADNLESKGI